MREIYSASTDLRTTNRPGQETVRAALFNSREVVPLTQDLTEETIPSPHDLCLQGTVLDARDV